MKHLIAQGPKGLKQILAVGDLCGEGGVWLMEQLASLPRMRLVYSDPPWNPGNAKYWRTHAGDTTRVAYSELLLAWCKVVVASGATDVFCEQSHIDKHRQMLFDAVAETPEFPPLLEQWIVYYGSLGCIRPNSLLHFGEWPISSNPANRCNAAMTREVFLGFPNLAQGWVLDPCIGKGMTSRMAHQFGMNCLGLELNPKRLAHTLQWLERKGYTIHEHN